MGKEKPKWEENPSKGGQESQTDLYSHPAVIYYLDVSTASRIGGKLTLISAARFSEAVCVAHAYGSATGTTQRISRSVYLSDLFEVEELGFSVSNF